MTQRPLFGDSGTGNVLVFARPKEQRTYVYCIRSGCFVKIGVTDNVGRRLSQLQTGSPEPLYLVGYDIGTFEDERRLHDELEQFRVRGEWFRMTEFVIRTVTGFIFNDDIYNSLDDGLSADEEARCQRACNEAASKAELDAIQDAYRKLRFERADTQMEIIITEAFGFSSELNT